MILITFRTFGLNLTACAVKAVLDNFNSSYEHCRSSSINQQATILSHQDNELAGMCRVISSKAFVENLLLMNEVLAELSMLSQVPQRESLTIRQAQCQIQWAIEGLQRRKAKAEELFTLTESMSTFKSVKVADHKAIFQGPVYAGNYRPSPAATNGS
jgi:hypothetical protein